MISVRSITKDFGRLRAIDHVSFEVEKGIVFGLLGPNGAGKSVLVNILTGLMRPGSGDVRVAGANPAGLSTRGAFHRRIGLVPEDQNLYQRLSAYENLRLFSRLYRLHDRRILDLLEEFGLLEKRKVKAKNLSQGMRQKLLIARALLHDPDVLFLDEPTKGLDAHMARHIREKIRKLRAAGKTIFLTTHTIEEAEELADRVAIIDKGKIIVDRPPDELKADFGRGAVARPSLRDVFIALTGKEIDEEHTDSPR
jgi:ABC-2 type transport system ATP-binding protein